MATQTSYSLKDVVSNEHAALVVVDVQNDFCHQEGSLGSLVTDRTNLEQAVDHLVHLIEEARRFHVPVVFIQTTHDRFNDSSVWLRARSDRPGGTQAPAVCATGTWGAEFYKVKPRPDERIVNKHRFSAFIGTDLEMTLRTLKRESVLVTGVTTNVCVESTAREAFMREFHVVLVEDCASAWTVEEHQATVHNIGKYFGQVADSQKVVALWSGEA